MNAKDLLQKGWVVEAMFLMLYVSIAAWFMPIERFNMLVDILPKLALLVAGQGAAAAIGPEVKRKIEKGK